MTKTQRLTNIDGATSLYSKEYQELLTSLEPKFKELQNDLANANSSAPIDYYKWLDFDYLAQTNEASKKLAQELSSKNYEHVLVVGMGGSGINSMVLENSLNQFTTKPKSFLVQNNLDPSSLIARLESINLDSTLFIIISKSGGTDEVRRNIATILNHWGDENKFAAQSVFITEPQIEGKKNFLHELRAELKTKTGHEAPFLENDPNIGGRFSMFSPVGMFSAELMGLDSSKMIEAAKAVFEEFKAAASIQEADIAKIAALDILLSRKNIQNRYSMVYADSLEAVNKFRAQLKGESLNKDGIDSTVHIAGTGTANHHSDLELLLKKNNGLVLEQVYWQEPNQDHTNTKSLDCLSDLEGQSNHQSLLTNHIQALSEYLIENKAPVIQTAIPKQNEAALAQFCLQDMLVTVVQAGLQDEIGSRTKLDLAIRQHEVERYKKSLKK